MIRIPNQFDQRAQIAPAASGGGTTSSSSCSSCVATLGVIALGPALLFSSLATSGPESAAAGARRLKPGRASALGLAIPLVLLALGWLAYHYPDATPLLAFVAIASWIGIFAYAYERTRDSAAAGIGIGVLWLIGLAVLALCEMFVWLGVAR